MPESIYVALGKLSNEEFQQFHRRIMHIWEVTMYSSTLTYIYAKSKDDVLQKLSHSPTFRARLTFEKGINVAKDTSYAVPEHELKVFRNCCYICDWEDNWPGKHYHQENEVSDEVWIAIVNDYVKRDKIQTKLINVEY